MSYTREELNALPEKILQEFLDKKSKCIGFNVFEAAANGKKKLIYSDWFFFCKKCEVQFVESILPLISDKKKVIQELTDLVKEMFPDCDIDLTFTGVQPTDENDEYYYNRNYQLHIDWS